MEQPPGLAYIFAQSVTGWHQTAKLTGTAVGDAFGWSVAVSGKSAVVSAPFQGAGSAYVFTQTPTGWRPVGALQSRDATAGDDFGQSVAISGDIIAVGAPQHDAKAGRAYVFDKTSNGWDEAELKGSDTVRQRGAGWVVVIDDGRDPLTGKRRQRWLSGYKTEKEAERALTAALAAQDKGERIDPPAKMAYGTYLLETWLPHLANRVELGTMRPSTFDCHCQLIKTHVLPAFGSMRLRSLGPAMLEAFYAELLRTGRKVRPGEPPAGLGPAMVRSIHVAISASLKYAVRRKLLTRNPASEVDELPAASKAQRPCWKAEQTSQFLEASRTDRLYPLYVLAITTGLRRGELAGLHWSELDLEAAKLTVSRTVVSIRGRAVESTPKTEKGRRTIAIAPSVVEALKVHRRRQLEERLAWGAGWVDTGLVFTREDGTGYRPDYILRAFKRAAERAGLPPIAFHALRHGHATAGLRAGIDLLTMSKRLGHNSVAITGDIYAHVVEELDREAAERTAALLLPQAANR
jgi:integrase